MSTERDAPSKRYQPTCFACKGRKRRGQYLCLSCWRQLPGVVRTQLNRRDRDAGWRLRQLLRQIHEEVPLSEITILDRDHHRTWGGEA